MKGTRLVLFMNANDMERLGLTDSETVDLVTDCDDGFTREVGGLRVVEYGIPEGNVGGYYPELNALIPSGTTTSRPRPRPPRPSRYGSARPSPWRWRTDGKWVFPAPVPRRPAPPTHNRSMTASDDAHARRQAIIDRLLAEALLPAEAGRSPSRDVLSDDMRRTVDALLAKAEAQRQRRLTYEDLEEALPPRDVTAEDLEAIFWILSEHGIAIEDGDPAGD